jgi:hypothetical protein
VHLADHLFHHLDRAGRPGRDVRLTAFTGTRTDALHGLLIRAGNGLCGRVLLTARPGSVDDYAADSRISHEYDKPVTTEGRL